MTEKTRENTADIDVLACTASELHKAFRSGDTDPVEILESIFVRMETANEALNAIVIPCREAAFRAAVESRNRIRAGQSRSYFEGIPLTIKDNLWVRDLRATWGSRLFEDHIAPRDELPVEVLRASGAVIIGKTNTPELSLAGFTYNDIFGETGNPWDPALSPSGSSGGAAAAVMSGLGPVALVTDAGGSARRPASHVGCVGFKPSPGEIPRLFGFPPLAHDLQSIGLLARSVEDISQLFNLLRKKPLGTVEPSGSYRIAAFAEIGELPVEQEVQRLWGQAIEDFSSLGHEVKVVAPPYDPDLMSALLMGLGAVGVHRVVRDFPDWEKRVTETIRQLALKGAKTSASDYVVMIDRITEIRGEMRDRFADFDFILTPTAPTYLWPKNEPAPKMVDNRDAPPRVDAIYTTFANVAGLAGVSVPAGVFENRHPLGLQLMAPPQSEDQLLGLAQQWEELHPWPRLAPDYSKTREM
ncbi:MAG: amidase [Methyloligellaceae bacterium]